MEARAEQRGTNEQVAGVDEASSANTRAEGLRQIWSQLAKEFKDSLVKEAAGLSAKFVVGALGFVALLTIGFIWGKDAVDYLSLTFLTKGPEVVEIENDVTVFTLTSTALYDDPYLSSEFRKISADTPLIKKGYIKGRPVDYVLHEDRKGFVDQNLVQPSSDHEIFLQSMVEQQVSACARTSTHCKLSELRTSINRYLSAHPNGDFADRAALYLNQVNHASDIRAAAADDAVAWGLNQAISEFGAKYPESFLSTFVANYLVVGAVVPLEAVSMMTIEDTFFFTEPLAPPLDGKPLNRGVAVLRDGEVIESNRLRVRLESGEVGYVPQQAVINAAEFDKRMLLSFLKCLKSVGVEEGEACSLSELTWYDANGGEAIAANKLEVERQYVRRILDLAQENAAIYYPALLWQLVEDYPKRFPESFLASFIQPAISDLSRFFKDCEYCPLMVRLPPMPDGSVLAVSVMEVTIEEFSRSAQTIQSAQEIGCEVWTPTGTIWSAGTSWRNVRRTETGKEHSVVCLSPNAAQAYAGWLNQIAGRATEYRLPRISEWKFVLATAEWRQKEACILGNVMDISLMNVVSGERQPSTGRTGGHFDCNDGFAFTAPGASGWATSTGIHGMYGNVSEMAVDDESKEVLALGPSWRTSPTEFELDGHHRLRAARSDAIGFRLVRTCAEGKQDCR